MILVIDIITIKNKFFILGMLSILYYILLSCFAWKISFSQFWIMLGAVFIGIGVVKEFEKSNKLYINKKFRMLMLICFIIGFILFIIIESLIIYFSINEQMEECDYLLILGAGLHGEKMSLTLSQRMDKSMEYLEKYPKTKIIVSGGQGMGEDITEAEAMGRFLLSCGISKNQIIKEEKSTNTSQNFRYSKEVLDKIDNRKEIKIAIVTTNFHMFRARFLAKRAGFKNIYSVPSELHPILIPNYYVRECFAVIKSFIFDR
ncbi:MULTISPECIES: YdcF family protein [Clostridium]|nr:YdcF family protein [Clostridium thermopalmarium]MBE6044391.1 YdcF family protein [Clostridium thermopalmarium]